MATRSSEQAVNDVADCLAVIQTWGQYVEEIARNTNAGEISSSIEEAGNKIADAITDGLTAVAKAISES